MDEIEEAIFLLTHTEEIIETPCLKTVYYVDSNGKGDGPCKMYEGDVLVEECYLVNGVKEGRYVFYHENGNLMIECFYVNGIKHGEYRSWDVGGDLIERYTYDKGIIKEGIQITSNSSWNK